MRWEFVVNREEYQELCDPEKILEWLVPYWSHEHLADIKSVSLDKYLAVAPDLYVVVAMLRVVLGVAIEQKAMAEYEEKKLPFKPYNELTEQEKIDQVEIRKYYLEGYQAGRDSAMIELANRITVAARRELDRYRLKNSEYDPKLVVDSPAHLR